MSKRDISRMVVVIIITLLIYSNDKLNRFFEQDLLQYANFYMIIGAWAIVGGFIRIYQMLKSIQRCYSSLYEQYQDMYIKMDDLKKEISALKSKFHKPQVSTYTHEIKKSPTP